MGEGENRREAQVRGEKEEQEEPSAAPGELKESSGAEGQLAWGSNQYCGRVACSQDEFGLRENPALGQPPL